ncbi:hypothetical protein GCM10022409_09400 [Hymenobacter glaciei]|uniref:TonB C-terminal domain-containing protein n=1 Tax=Hymenobacter glaciei TaxID=877209 RepID=A0ABP7TK53_9BACT
MLLLPTFNAKLNPCPVNPTEFAPHPQGNFCGQCERVVHDFSQSPNPRADLAAARAAAPDGCVCGRLGAAQVQDAPALSRRLRWFVAALVLVVAQGMTAREALAQVRRTVARATTKHLVSKQMPQYPESFVDGEIEALPDKKHSSLAPATTRTYAEVMPTLQGRSYPQIAAYVQQHVKWPQGSELVDAEGRVFVSFVVSRDGLLRDAKVVKGIHPLLDAEALRVVRELPAFTPGKQSGQAVPVSMTLPITFRRE